MRYPRAARGDRVGARRGRTIEGRDRSAWSRRFRLRPRRAAAIGPAHRSPNGAGPDAQLGGRALPWHGSRHSHKLLSSLDYFDGLQVRRTWSRSIRRR